jgi:hypothetical protein
MKETTTKLVTSWGKRTDSNRYLCLRLIQAKETLLLCPFFLQLVITGNLQLTKLGQLLGCRFLPGSDCRASITRTATLFSYLFSYLSETKLYPWILGPGGMLETVHGQPSCTGEVKTSIMYPDASAHSHSRQVMRYPRKLA